MSPLIYDRMEELRFLNQHYQQDKFNMIVVYGRRRVGKTTLLKAFCEKKKHIYYLCTSDSLQSNINKLKQEFYELSGDETFLAISGNLYDLLKYLVKVVVDQKIVLAIDEFPYLLETDRSVASVLQKVVDEVLVNSRLFLILSGSSIGMMENDVLGYSSPLYGRRTGSWKVEPFKFEEIHYFYRRGIEDMVKAYSVFGGIPFYLSQVDSRLSVEENISKKILSKNEVLYQEPDFVITQEFRETRNYKNVLSAIASGKVKTNEISMFTGMDSSNLSKYLYLLREVNLVEHTLPYGSKRNGIYSIRDNFIRFYFKFVYPHREMVEIDESEKLIRLIKKDINAYYGKVFEEIVIDLIDRKKIRLPFEYDSVYRYWKNEIEIDGILVNSNDSSLTIVEVKWSDAVDARRIISELKDKISAARLSSKINGYVVVAKSFKLRPKEAFTLDLDDIKKELWKT